MREMPHPVAPALGALPGRPLQAAELLDAVRAIAGRPPLWAPHTPAVGHERHYVCLHRDAHVDVWAIFWMPDNDTGWHDHDISSGAVRVVRGTLVEHVLRIGGDDWRSTHRARSDFSFGPSHIHRLTCSEPGSASIHAYSPPLWRLGQYGVSPDGVLHRQSISYADELRPLELSTGAS
jgi:hypothetical protein